MRYYRHIVTHDEQPKFANRRPVDAKIPEFSFFGTLRAGSISGKYYPNRPVLLTSYLISARGTGVADSVVVIIVGDDVFLPNGEWIAAPVLAGGEVSATARLDESLWHRKVHPSQWINVVCLEAGGHSEVVVQIYGEVLG